MLLSVRVSLERDLAFGYFRNSWESPNPAFSVTKRPFAGRTSRLPLKCGTADGLISAEHGVFDYGCGRGQDVELLRASGFSCNGWDPAYFPGQPRLTADVVNLGYVINVIESPEERAAALRDAWQLCRRLLVVSAQVTVSGRGSTQVAFGDGVVTSRGTFQKYFTQDELKAYLEKELNCEAIAAGLGIFYAFKDEAAAQGFQAKRHRRREAIPRRRFSEVRFEENRQLLEPLMAVVARLGRVPEMDELQQAEELVAQFGSLKNAFALVRRITGDDQWKPSRSSPRTYSCIWRLADSGKDPRCRFSRSGSSATSGLFSGAIPTHVNRRTRCSFKREMMRQSTTLAGVRRLENYCLMLSTFTGVRWMSLAPLLRIYEGCTHLHWGDRGARIS